MDPYSVQRLERLPIPFASHKTWFRSIDFFGILFSDAPDFERTKRRKPSSACEISPSPYCNYFQVTTYRYAHGVGPTCIRCRSCMEWDPPACAPSLRGLAWSRTRLHTPTIGYSNSDKFHSLMSTVAKSTNIFWQECSVGKLERQKLLKQKGCVVWITGLSGSGKSTLACALSQELHSRGKLTYILDGDNVRHGLNKDLGFRAEDRTENIRRIGEVAKLFADAGLICITSLISPYRNDRDACRTMVPEGFFIEVFMNIPLEVCELRDPKGLYKLAREGKIKGFTGIDDPYEPPLNCEIEITPKDGVCPTPSAMAEQIASFLEGKGILLE